MQKLAEVAEDEENEIQKQIDESFKNSTEQQQEDDVDLTEDYFDIFNSYQDKHSPIFPIQDAKTTTIPLISSKSQSKVNHRYNSAYHSPDIVNIS